MTDRWLGWGNIKDSGGDLLGTYFFIKLPFYKMVQDYAWARERMVMGQLRFMHICFRNTFTLDWENEKYRFDFIPIYDDE